MSPIGEIALIVGLTLLAIVASAVACLSLLITLIALRTYRRRAKQLTDTLQALEEAFDCDLLGPDPYINVFEYPMAGKIWMVPCTEPKKDTKK